MTLPAVIRFSLPPLCPLHAFAFPSVSLFLRCRNLVWINYLRSDYPLKSASAEWSYFGPLGLGQYVRAPLPLEAMLLLWLRAEASRAVANESCPHIGIGVWVDRPRALPSRPKSQAKNTLRGDLFNGRHVRTRLSRTESRRLYTAQLPPPKFPAKWQTTCPEPSRCSAETRATITAEAAQGICTEQVHPA